MEKFPAFRLFVVLLAILPVCNSCRQHFRVNSSEKVLQERSASGQVQVKYPVFTNMDEDFQYACDSINSRVRKFIDGLVQDVKKQDASEDEIFHLMGIHSNYELFVDYDLEILASGLVSIRFSIYTYKGGAHGTSYFKCFAFNARDFVQLYLKDLLHLERKHELMSLNRLLKKYFSDPDNCFNQPPFITTDFDSFSIEKDTMVFSYPDRSLGPYVCGAVVVKVPFWELKQHGLIKVNYQDFSGLNYN